ncbi:MAG: hypothetical protein PHC83_01810 [Bacteroidales bacterium]|jgi:hypothetical protein|nr:hypothetical protein [Bacteroidales bacterium]MDD4208986.1 hypothetical protein [Bacteroidales bacterium]
MKLFRITCITILLLTLITNGCVKQKDCDCSEVMTGTWQYLEEPVYKEVCSYKEVKIVAVFTEEGGGDVYFTGSVPSRYQSLTPVEVRLCAKLVYEGYHIQPDDCCAAYKLTCIEKED